MVDQHRSPMRYVTLLLTGLLLPCAASAQQVNEAVEIDYNGTWYPGKVLKVEGERFYVAYDEWSETWNEWVGKERLRAIKPGDPPPPPQPPPAPERKYAVGDRVEIQFGFSTVNATVVGFHEIGYELQVDGMSTMPYREDLIIRKL